jgi:transcriptional regulator with XRE-family HTH domain
LNETLRRALLQARLSEEDVAARLEVDPKTVRRWLEGRVPYLRHRWALAAMLGQDEADLWPQVRTTRPRPAEVQAIYPHHDSVPNEVWQDFFRSAKHEIDILADTELFLAADAETLAILTHRAKAGVQQRICLSHPDWPGASDVPDHTREALCRHAHLCQVHNVQVRTYRAPLNNAIYRVDDELLISPQAFGIPAGRTPVLRLHGTVDSDMITTYFESFDHIWSSAQPLDPDRGLKGKS